MKANLVAKCALLMVLTASAALAQEATPIEKYNRLRQGLANAGYTSSQINAIVDVAGIIVKSRVCPPEGEMNEGLIEYMIVVTARTFGRPKDELAARAQEIIPAMIEVLAADPAAKADFCGPFVGPDDNAPKG